MLEYDFVPTSEVLIHREPQWGHSAEDNLRRSRLKTLAYTEIVLFGNMDRHPQRIDLRGRRPIKLAVHIPTVHNGLHAFVSFEGVHLLAVDNTVYRWQKHLAA